MTGRNHSSGGDENKNRSDIGDLPETVASIVESMKKGRLSRLVVSRGDFHLELEAPASKPERSSAPASSSEETDSEAPDEPPSTSHVIASPMIGTFYAAPAPGEPAFVRVGDSISQGDTVGIVEAMKIMNEIAADRSGKVVRIVATNGETVEYGSPLIEIDPGD